MSTPATIPVFDPQGILRDIPADQLRAAVSAGGTPSVRFKAPNGDIHFVPANRTQEALRAGGQLQPIEQQEIQHPGFWSALGSDLKGMATSMAPPTTQEGLLQKAKMLKEAITGPDPRELAQDVIDRANKGYGPAYAAIAPTAEQLGVNVKGMEQSAAQGDVGGVYGHAAAVPAVTAAGMAVGEVAPALAEKGAPVVRASVKAANKALKGAPKAVGAAAGGAIGAATHIPYMAPTLAALGGIVGPEILPKLRIPGEGFGLPGRVAGGTPVAPSYAESLGPVAGGPAAAPSYAESLGPVTGGPATAPSYAESLGPVRGGPRRAPSYEKFSGTGKLSEMGDIDARLRSIAQNLEKEKTPAPEEEDLTAKGQASVEAAIDKKVLSELNKQAGLTVSLETLGKSPALNRFTPEQLQASAVRLRDAGKVWGHEAKAGGEAASRIYGIASR